MYIIFNLCLIKNIENIKNVTTRDMKIEIMLITSIEWNQIDLSMQKNIKKNTVETLVEVKTRYTKVNSFSLILINTPFENRLIIKYGKDEDEYQIDGISDLTTTMMRLITDSSDRKLWEVPYLIYFHRAKVDCFKSPFFSRQLFPTDNERIFGRYRRYNFSKTFDLWIYDSNSSLNFHIKKIRCSLKSDNNTDVGIFEEDIGKIQLQYYDILQYDEKGTINSDLKRISIHQDNNKIAKWLKETIIPHTRITISQYVSKETDIPLPVSRIIADYIIPKESPKEPTSNEKIEPNQKIWPEPGILDPQFLPIGLYQVTF